MSTTTRTWFITGSSRGFGRVWAEAALNRGDNVVLTARNTDAVADLIEQFPEQAHAVQLDVTDRDAVFAAVQEGLDRFGQLDIIVANAGYGLFGAVEETTEDQARRQIEVNVFGALWLLQAIAPVLRAQQHGRVLITSSFGGLMSFPTAALYGASKYAVEGLGESFAQETQDFGTKVTLIEPGAYATDFMGDSGDQTEPNPAYDGARGRTGEFFSKMPVADPTHTGDAILALTDMDQPPLRLILGEHAMPLVVDTYNERIASWQEHQPLTASAQ